MSETTVGTWHARNAFGDETLSQERLSDALEIVKRMDVDVLALPETASHGIHSDELERERLEEIKTRMACEGYAGLIATYTSVAGEYNAHYMSLWTRVGHLHTSPESTEVRLYGKRSALRLVIPSMGMSVHGIHLNDRYPHERVKSARALVAAEAGYTGESIVMGDFNDMYEDDRRSRIPRAIGRVVNGIEVKDYYDTSKRFQRLAGKIIRVCRMSGGESLKVFATAGFHDADPSRQPTISNGPIAFQIDHILGSSGIDFTDFAVHQRSATPTSQPLSYHWPITTRVRRSA